MALKPAKKCKCGNFPRPKKHDCPACHKVAVRQYRSILGGLNETMFGALVQSLTNFDDATVSDFEARIKTKFVELLTVPGAPVYRGLPVGFLTDNRIQVLYENRVMTFDLKQLKNYGPKREKTLFSYRTRSKAF